MANAKWFFLLLLIIILVGGFFVFKKPSKTPSSQTTQNTWQVGNPSKHTFVSPDQSFSFVYPTEWVYETIDGIVPAQQHIVNLGRQLSITERKDLAKNAGVELNDTLSGLSYTAADITLYYSNTFPVNKLEDLATGPILSKKQISVGNVPALDVTVDCPTECREILFTKNQATFVFLQARPQSQTIPLDNTKLTQILSTFKFTN